LICGSGMAYVGSLLCFILILVRTSREDKTLRQELPGYEEYAQRVPCRLAPNVW
jgi:protein-S-isoprenylcysteine O-methyltransferase Ste14